MTKKWLEKTIVTQDRCILSNSRGGEGGGLGREGGGGRGLCGVRCAEWGVIKWELDTKGMAIKLSFSFLFVGSKYLFFFSFFFFDT